MSSRTSPAGATFAEAVRGDMPDGVRIAMTEPEGRHEPGALAAVARRAGRRQRALQLGERPPGLPHDVGELGLHGLLRVGNGRRGWCRAPPAGAPACPERCSSTFEGARFDVNGGSVRSLAKNAKITASLVWLWVVEMTPPDRWDLAGATIALAGAAVIVFSPRAWQRETVLGRGWPLVLAPSPERAASAASAGRCRTPRTPG